MIQRIQSVYLLLSTICLGLMFVFSFAKFTVAEGGKWVYNVMGLDSGSGPEDVMSIPLFLIVALMMVYNLLIMFLYKNRKRQLFFNRVNYVLHGSVIALIYLSLFRIPNAFESVQEVEYGIGIFMPVASLAFVFLATRGIKKDEALVRSLDRLR